MSRIPTYGAALLGLCLSAASAVRTFGDGGELWGMGDNSGGQLGLAVDSSTVPVLIDTEVTAVAASLHHTLYITDDGCLWGMGRNTYGQLGTGDTDGRTEPAFIDDGVRDVLTSWYHTFYIKYDGTLWGMGRNQVGQLGLGDVKDRPAPVMIKTDVIQAVPSYGHSLLIQSDGSLWGMGPGRYGRLGTGNESDHFTPYRICGDVMAAAAGSLHSLILKADGNLYGMGKSIPGALGHGDSLSHLSPDWIASGVRDLDGSMNSTYFIRTDATLWGMGANSYGQLGTGDEVKRVRPILIESGVKSVVAGDYHALFIRDDDTLWGMGGNSAGQLGVGDETDRAIPVEVAVDVHTAAVGASHSLFIVGWRAPVPEILQPPQSVTVAPGGSACFEVVTTRKPGEHYIWKKDGETIGEDRAVLNLVDVGPADAGFYCVCVRTEGGEVTCRTVMLGISETLNDGVHLENMSSRGLVEPGGRMLILGFVIGGEVPRRVLVRAIGPGLTGFGVEGVLENPALRIMKSVDGAPVWVASNDDWVDSAELAAASREVGAFALPEGSCDAAILTWLEPGAYTAQVFGADGETGVALAEVYEVRPTNPGGLTQSD
ncbi:MAG: hypothetical protein R3F07_18200 [Opitutaceae bacterium]